MSQQITPDWCESFIAAQERELERAVASGWVNAQRHCNEVILLARLAARALRAREWCEAEMQSASEDQENATTDAEAWRSEGREHAMRQLYDILTGVMR